MNEYIYIGLTLLLSLFGSGFIGKFWANRILEKEKAKYSKEIEYYKTELEKELTKLNAIKEKALYISKAQYDNEYRIYQEIWEKMHSCIVYSSLLYPHFEKIPKDENEREKYNRNKYTDFANAYNNYSSSIDKYAPFYKDDFYKDFISVKKLCSELGNNFDTYEFDMKSYPGFSSEGMDKETRKRVYIEIPKELEDIKVKLRKQIREYLLGLQLKED